MSEQYDSRIIEDTDQGAIDTFEGEGGALAHGPHVQSDVEDTHRITPRRSWASKVLTNSYTSGIGAAAIFEAVRELAALVF